MKKSIKDNQLDPQFKYDIANRPGGESLFNCFACGKCSAVCPISEVDEEFKPRKIIYMILLGMKEEVLNNEFIWLCATCDACSFRCPQEVRMADIMGVARKIAEEEGYVPAGLNQQMEASKAFSKINELNAKYTLWEKIKKNIKKNKDKLQEKESFSYLDDFELCIDMALDFIKKYPDSLLLNNVLEFLNDRFRLYFFHIEDITKSKEGKRLLKVLLKYNNLLEKFPSPSEESLIVKNIEDIIHIYEKLGEKKFADNLIQMIKKRFSKSKLRNKNNQND